MSNSLDVVESILQDLMSCIIPKMKSVFFGTKRSGGTLKNVQSRQKQSRISDEQNTDEFREKISKLESEINLLTENLNYVSKERDHLRLELDTERMRAEKLADENHALSETTLELRRLTEDQGRGCVQILTRVLEVVWTVTGHSGAGGLCQGLTARQMTDFVKLCSDLILQLTAEAADTTRHNSCDNQMLLKSVIGCLVNLTTHKDIMSTIQDACPSLISQLSSLMGDSNDVKLLRLTMMLMCNLLSQEHLYAATVSFVVLFLL
jgi:regulator of replication initiation timing